MTDELIAAKRARGCSEAQVAAWVLELADVARAWIANASPLPHMRRRGIPS